MQPKRNKPRLIGYGTNNSESIDKGLQSDTVVILIHLSHDVKSKVSILEMVVIVFRID